MVQSQSLSTLTICGSVQVYSSWRNRLNSGKSSGLISDRCVSCQFLRRSSSSSSSSLRSHWKSIKQRNLLKVEARWPFQESDQGLDASSERSESANEDILIFFFQLDLATRVQVSGRKRNSFEMLQDWIYNMCICVVLKWQYALNVEQYDVAQQLREKLNEVIKRSFVKVLNVLIMLRC